MIGITFHTTYVPRHRLPRALIAAAWNTKAMPGAKAVAGFDEDSLTMAHAALSARPAGMSAPDRVSFASTSSPYWQRSAASQIAAALDLPSPVMTNDFGGSLRAGTSALIGAIDAVSSGNAASVWVAAADQRDGEPESTNEILFGDAAAAIGIGAENVQAEFIAYASVNDDFPDEWRRSNDLYVRGIASKYSQSRGYQANVDAAVKAVLANAHLDPSQISLPPPVVPDIGNTGAAMPLLQLSHALNAAHPGDFILCAGHGDGADALLFRATDAIAHSPLPTEKLLEHSSYSMYRKLRWWTHETAGGAEISNVLWKLEQRQNIRLHGSRCLPCGAVSFPIARVCPACRVANGQMEQALSRAGRVFTFTKDFLYDAPVQPTIMTVVDLDGGGRFLCQMTDTDVSAIAIGMTVELVLRRMREGSQNHHYYWKCRPT